MDDHFPDWLMESLRRERPDQADDIAAQLTAAARKADVRLDELFQEPGQVGLPGKTVPVESLGTVLAVFNLLRAGRNRGDAYRGLEGAARKLVEQGRASDEQAGDGHRADPVPPPESDLEA